MSEQTTRSQQASFSPKESGRAPPLIILITRTPYGTEMASGALSFAVACAAQGILTKVIFIEDGVYTLTGNHMIADESEFFSLPEIINAVAGNDNLQFYAFQPSLHRRGMSKNPKLNAVLDIGITELGQLLFYPPKGVQAGHQRVMFF